MINATFRIGGDLISVKVEENTILFFETATGLTSTIEGLRLDKSGVLKEFPDLENDPEWKRKTIERFKEHIKKFPSEMKKINYVKDELKKHGYEPLYYMPKGWRPKKFET